MKEFTYIMNKLLEGFGITLGLFAVTLVLSIPLGLLISFGTRSKIKPISYICRTLVWIVRGSPLMLQILLISFIPNMIFKVYNKDLAMALNVSINMLMFIFVAIAFTINYACYFSEIFRGAIDSISKGQYEAGQVLGMTKSQIFFKVILLQLVKRALPPCSNEIITLVKDTALASTLGVFDLLATAKSLVNSLVILTPLVYCAVFYLVFNGLLTIIFSKLEKKLAFYKE